MIIVIPSTVLTVFALGLLIWWDWKLCATFAVVALIAFMLLMAHDPQHVRTYAPEPAWTAIVAGIIGLCIVVALILGAVGSCLRVRDWWRAR